MKHHKYLFFYVLLWITTSHVSAQNPQLGIGISLNSLGLGGHFSYQFNNKPSSLKISGNYGSIHAQNYELPFNGLTLLGDVKYTSGGFGIYFDWHPFNNLFKIISGISYNNIQIDGNLRLKDTLILGEIQITPEEIGAAQLNIKPSSFMPYLGLGYGRSVPNIKRLNFNIEFGTYYAHSNKVKFNCSGLIEPTKEQENLIQNNLKDYQWIPNFNIALNYRLF